MIAFLSASGVLLLIATAFMPCCLYASAICSAWAVSMAKVMPFLFAASLCENHPIRENVFDKPDEQSEVYFDFVMARKRRMKSKV